MQLNLIKGLRGTNTFRMWIASFLLSLPRLNLSFSNNHDDYGYNRHQRTSLTRCDLFGKKTESLTYAHFLPPSFMFYINIPRISLLKHRFKCVFSSSNKKSGRTFQAMLLILFH